jgi:hypothetical protein
MDGGRAGGDLLVRLRLQIGDLQFRRGQLAARRASQLARSPDALFCPEPSAELSKTVRACSSGRELGLLASTAFDRAGAAFLACSNGSR